MNAVRWVVWSVAALVVATAASGQVRAVDPQSLVGEWEGYITGMDNASPDVRY
jgi:hypothetical protein